MPIIINQPEPEPSPTPIPVKNTLAVVADNLLQYTENVSSDNSTLGDEPVTLQNMLDNNAAIVAILRAFSNET